ncbi:ABC transporter substrate-binding protein [Gracilibacillus alcaliphilus]|uniref:ABC transporter substrate-binding protein n=1 Tax=Gracilibacillus alcaliphilus TaxID=1401441 RepID=UPI00195D527A|nr:sugar ABC transporter substrate-binding protein [Gracilibacillus alcaliphilus]MBM7677472.1 multiple sugar transport system substrate-binding protein [Gracilibacillus alcaliphilus]
MGKTLHIVLLIVISAVILAGCGTNTGSDDNTLEVALWDEKISGAVDASIEEFNKEHPDVEVKVTYTPYANYFTKLRTSLGGGSGPDVFWMNGPNFYEYATFGLIKDLEPFIEKDSEFSKDVYFDSVIDLYSHEGHLYAAPYFSDIVGLFYNKRLFDEAGLDYPDETWTWDDIKEKGELLTNKEAGIYGYSASVVSNQAGYYNLIPQAGGYMINEEKTKSGFDSPETREALHFVKDLIDEGIAPTVQTQIESNPRDLFMSGLIAIHPEISVNAEMFYSELGDDLGVAPLPAGKEEATITHGIGWAMNGDTEKEELAWELIKHLSGEKGNQFIAETGFSIPAQEDMSDLWVESIPGLDLQVFIDAQEVAYPYPLSQNTIQWQDIEQAEIQGAFLGYKSIDEALDNVAKEMNLILDTEQID